MTVTFCSISTLSPIFYPLSPSFPLSAPCLQAALLVAFPLPSFPISSHSPLIPSLPFQFFPLIIISWTRNSCLLRSTVPSGSYIFDLVCDAVIADACNLSRRCFHNINVVALEHLPAAAADKSTVFRITVVEYNRLWCRLRWLLLKLLEHYRVASLYR